MHQYLVAYTKRDHDGDLRFVTTRSYHNTILTLENPITPQDVKKLAETLHEQGTTVCIISFSKFC